MLPERTDGMREKGEIDRKQTATESTKTSLAHIIKNSPSQGDTIN